jgi:CubicO group peptidase (beta-lactamase class C family)
MASVSKVFVTTAVMQLAERNEVRLDADVDRYLALFKLPATFPQPVTLAHLLTHTGGFDGRTIGRAASTAADLRPLGQYLADRMPPRVLPPGIAYSYSNHGFALAGYVVEVVAKTPFGRYVEEHIFRPLGMRHSSFAQPLPPHLATALATGYAVGDGAAPPQPVPWAFFNDAPAVALSATARDMAPFMIAHLEGGRAGATRVLQAATVAMMHRAHFTAYPPHPGHPPMPSMAYGFERYVQNGQLVLSKQGDITGFSSLITLLPDKRLGFFLVGNMGDNGYVYDLQHRLLDHYYAPPRTVPAVRSAAASTVSLEGFTGSYWSNEYARGTIEKLAQLRQQVQITAPGDGSLLAHGLYGQTLRLTRRGPLWFQTTYGQTLLYIAFQQDTNGAITHLLPASLAVFDKIAWYDTTAIVYAAMGIFSLLFLLGCAGGLLRPLARRLRRTGHSGPQAARARPRLDRSAWAIAGLLSALNLLFLGGANVQAQSGLWTELGVLPSVLALLCLPLMTTPLALGALVCAVVIWRTTSWSLTGQLHYSLVTLGALAFIPFLIHWNLLGFRY